MKKEIISTQKAPSAIGPYSQGVKYKDLVFTSGQLPINRETGELVSTIKEATEQAIKNLEFVLKEAGTCLESVIKVTIFLKDLNNFSLVNEVYGSYFKENSPARSAYEVSRLPMDAVIEIEAIAHI